MIRRALLCALLALTLIAPVSAAQSSDPLVFDDVDSECSTTATMAPEQHETPFVGDWTTPVTLDVAVLLIGVDEASAERFMSFAAEPYKDLNIEMRWTFERANLAIDPSSDSDAYIQASKDHFGGTRPWWSDVVYTLIGGKLGTGVVGSADCVGGIEYSDAAFAVGAADTSTPYALRTSGKIAAHEIAHLLAAHHHYANCAEGENAGDDNEVSYCSLMFNDAGFVTLKFSTLEGAVVRRWALDYANAPKEMPADPEPEPEPDPTSEPTPEPDPEPLPEPEPSVAPSPGGNEDPAEVERSLTLRIEGTHARGRIKTATETSSCVSNVPIALQRKRNGKWTFTAAAFSEEDGRYAMPVSANGIYRTIAQRVEREDYDCRKAVSRTRRAYI